MIILGAIGLLGLLDGIVSQYLFPQRYYPPSDIPFMIAVTLLVFSWYRLDTEQYGYRRTRWLNIGVVAFAVLALPYYFFRTRGAKNGFIATGIFVVAVLIYSMLQSVGQYIILYGIQR